MEINTTITKLAMECAERTTDFVLNELDEIVSWQMGDSDLSGDDFELAKRLALKTIIEHLQKIII
jgi:hypothetical protein